MNSAEISNESLQLSIDFSPRLKKQEQLDQRLIEKWSFRIPDASFAKERERERGGEMRTTYVIRARV